MSHFRPSVGMGIVVLIAGLVIGHPADAGPAEQGLVTLPSSDQVQVDVRILDANGNPRNTFNVGERLQIEVNTQAQSANRIYLNLVEIDANGQCTLVFPNAFSGNPEVATGRFVVPDNNSYRLQVTPPQGTDVVQAFASTEPFDLRDVFNASTTQQTPFANLCTDPNAFAQQASNAAQGLAVEGNIATGFTTFTVGTQPANRAPIAQFSFTPLNPGVGDVITFDASASQDPDGQIARYEWDFDGDGRTDVLGQRARVRFNSAGQANVTLTVTDIRGATGSITKTVTVGQQNQRPTARFSVSPSNPMVGESVTFDGTSSADADGRIVSWRWTFEGGNRRLTLQGARVNVRFTNAGTVNVTLTVTDDNGATNSTSQTLTVGRQNQAPNAQFSVSPQQPEVGQTVTLDARASSDPDGQIQQYDWDIDNDGRTDASGPVVQTSFNQPGLFQVRLTVTDDRGATDSVTRSISVQQRNQAPIARFSISPTDPQVGQPVTFDGRNSSDPDGQIASYAWDFDGDGRIDASDPVVQRSFNQAASFTVTLTVTDDRGRQDSLSQTINVRPSNRAPIAQFNVQPLDPRVDEQITFDASNSFDPDGQITRYKWDFGDGASAFGRTVTHRYRSSGPVTVTLTVTDDLGSTSSSTQQLRVRAGANQAPVVNFQMAPSNPRVNEQVTFDASNSFDPDGQITRYEWSFGDNSSATGRTVTHSYRSSGSFSVTLRVFDNQGSSSFTTQSVFVQAVPNQTPVASFNVSTATPDVGEPVTFSSTAFDPDGSIVQTQWAFGDGAGAQGRRVQHAYSRSGTFTATLTVTDNRGATASVSRQIEVGAQLPSEPGFYVDALDDSRFRIVVQGRPGWASNRTFSLGLEADGQFTSVERRSGGAVPQGLQPQPVNRSSLELDGAVGGTPVQYIVGVSGDTGKVKFDLRLDIDGNGQPERSKDFVTLGPQLKQAPSNPFVINFEPGNLAPLTDTRVCLVLVDQPGFQFTLCVPYDRL